jgi:predicted membrane channel-forming protein YqfA (hemolysin III family)
MSQQTSASFRGSPLAQRIGSAILGAFIAIYLAIITYTFSDRVRSTKGVVTLIFLWLIGLLALGMLSRAWRKPSSGKSTSAQ